MKPDRWELVQLDRHPPQNINEPLEGVGVVPGEPTQMNNTIGPPPFPNLLHRIVSELFHT